MVPKDAPLSVQNNNPGNLRSFGDTPTVDTPTGKFAKFETVELGIRALAKDLGTKIARGDSTIQEILTQYSPDEGKHNKAKGSKVADYIAFASKQSGLAPDESITNDQQLFKVIRAIVDFESGHKSNITDEQIRQGILDAKTDR